MPPIQSILPLVEEDQATPEVARIYNEMKLFFQEPMIPNAPKAVAVSPVALQIQWDMLRSFYKNTTLPQALISMIFFTVAESNNCQYCSANNEFYCRVLGVDQQTLEALSHDLENISPERLRDIIVFAVRAARQPKDLNQQDFDRLREHGLSDSEMVEIIQAAAIANLNDTLADALKIPVEIGVQQALNQR